MIYSNSRHEWIQAFVGYRRHSETLVTVNALASISGATGTLSETPPILPDLIREKACIAALYHMDNRLKGRFSGQRRIHNTGGNSVTIDAADPNYLRREMRGLRMYRKHVT